MIEVISIKEVLEFVLKHRGKTVWIDMSKEDIVIELYLKSSSDELYFYKCPTMGTLQGVMVLDVDKANKVVFVRRNLNITPGAIMAMCKMFKEKFKGWRLKGNKHGPKEYSDPIALVKRWAALAERKYIQQQKVLCLN